MKKEGLSAVISVVLMILIVLAATGIIWFVIRPAISSGAGRIGEAECISLILNIEQCTSTDGTSPYSIRINRGADETNLVSLSFIFSDENNSDIVKVDASQLDPLETKTYIDLIVEGNLIASEVDVAGTIASDDGKEYICQPTNIHRECN